MEAAVGEEWDDEVRDFLYECYSIGSEVWEAVRRGSRLQSEGYAVAQDETNQWVIYPAVKPPSPFYSTSICSGTWKFPDIAPFGPDLVARAFESLAYQCLADAGFVRLGRFFVSLPPLDLHGLDRMWDDQRGLRGGSIQVVFTADGHLRRRLQPSLLLLRPARSSFVSRLLSGRQSSVFLAPLGWKGMAERLWVDPVLHDHLVTALHEAGVVPRSVILRLACALDDHVRNHASLRCGRSLVARIRIPSHGLVCTVPVELLFQPVPKSAPRAQLHPSSSSFLLGEDSDSVHVILPDGSSRPLAPHSPSSYKDSLEGISSLSHMMDEDTDLLIPPGPGCALPETLSFVSQFLLATSKRRIPSGGVASPLVGQSPGAYASPTSTTLFSPPTPSFMTVMGDDPRLSPPKSPPPMPTPVTPGLGLLEDVEEDEEEDESSLGVREMVVEHSEFEHNNVNNSKIAGGNNEVSYKVGSLEAHADDDGHRIFGRETDSLGRQPHAMALVTADENHSDDGITDENEDNFYDEDEGGTNFNSEMQISGMAKKKGEKLGGLGREGAHVNLGLRREKYIKIEKDGDAMASVSPKPPGDPMNHNVSSQDGVKSGITNDSKQFKDDFYRKPVRESTSMNGDMELDLADWIEPQSNGEALTLNVPTRKANMESHSLNESLALNEWAPPEPTGPSPEQTLSPAPTLESTRMSPIQPLPEGLDWLDTRPLRLISDPASYSRRLLLSPIHPTYPSAYLPLESPLKAFSGFLESDLSAHRVHMPASAFPHALSIFKSAGGDKISADTSRHCPSAPPSSLKQVSGDMENSLLSIPLHLVLPRVSHSEILGLGWVQNISPGLLESQHGLAAIAWNAQARGILPQEYEPSGESSVGSGLINVAMETGFHVESSSWAEALAVGRGELGSGDFDIFDVMTRLQERRSGRLDAIQLLEPREPAASMWALDASDALDAGPLRPKSHGLELRVPSIQVYDPVSARRLAVAPEATMLWEKAGLAPVNARKNVVYGLLWPGIATSLEPIDAFLRQLTAMYVFCELGSHEPTLGSLSDSSDLRMDYTTGGESIEDMQAVMNALSKSASMLSVRIGERLASSATSLVIYAVIPFALHEHVAAVAMRVTASATRALEALGQPPPVIQLLSLSEIILKVAEPAALRELAFSVFEKLRRFPYEYAADMEGQARPSLLYEPTVRLATPCVDLLPPAVSLLPRSMGVYFQWDEGRSRLGAVLADSEGTFLSSRVLQRASKDLQTESKMFWDVAKWAARVLQALDPGDGVWNVVFVTVARASAWGSPAETLSKEIFAKLVEVFSTVATTMAVSSLDVVDGVLAAAPASVSWKGSVDSRSSRLVLDQGVADVAGLFSPPLARGVLHSPPPLPAIEYRILHTHGSWEPEKWAATLGVMYHRLSWLNYSPKKQARTSALPLPAAVLIRLLLAYSSASESYLI